MFCISNSSTPLMPSIWTFRPRGSGYWGANSMICHKGKTYRPNMRRGPRIIKILAFFIFLVLCLFGPFFHGPRSNVEKAGGPWACPLSCLCNPRVPGPLSSPQGPGELDVGVRGGHPDVSLHFLVEGRAEVGAV